MKNQPAYVDNSFHCERPDLTSIAIAGQNVVVQYPMSCTYADGIIVDGKLYSGYTVPKPLIPDGFELLSNGYGTKCNVRPPMATGILRQKPAPTKTPPVAPRYASSFGM